MTNKCDCYEQCEVLYHWHLNSNGKNSKVTRTFTGICNGTKEREECHCGGDRVKCDFYPEIKKAAKRETKDYRNKKELEFYRWWVTKHNLNVEVAKAFEEYLKENN